MISSVLNAIRKCGIIAQLMLENTLFSEKKTLKSKKVIFFYFNHLSWVNKYYIQRNRSQYKKEMYFLITSNFDTFSKSFKVIKYF